MSEILGIGVILLVAGIMVYMQLTAKQHNKQLPGELELHEKAVAAFTSFAALFEKLHVDGYLKDPAEKERYLDAFKLLAETANYFDPANKDRRTDPDPTTIQEKQVS